MYPEVKPTLSLHDSTINVTYAVKVLIYTVSQKNQRRSLTADIYVVTVITIKCWLLFLLTTTDRVVQKVSQQVS